MMLFVSMAALLTLAALVIVLRPLLRREANAGVPAADTLNLVVYRDQLREMEADRAAGTLGEDDYRHARLELERRLLEDVEAPTMAVPLPPRTASRTAAIVVGLAVPLLAAGIYFAAGDPHSLTTVELPKDASKGVTAAQIEAMIAKLAERVKQKPDDPVGWAMLGKSYAVMGRFDDAATAYTEAAKRAPDNPNVLADYAEALAMSRGQSLQGEPEALALRALKLDPNHLKALALAGSAAMERNDGAAATRLWEKLATLIPPESEMARDIAASIKEARTLPGGADAVAGTTAGTPAGSAPRATAAAFSGLSGTVTLAPALAARAAPGDTVFVFARAAAGPRMPLAILRKKVSDLPLRFTLDDSAAMSPAAKLSAAPMVIVGARISKSGNALPASGDLQGLSAPLAHDSKGVAVVIDSVVP